MFGNRMLFQVVPGTDKSDQLEFKLEKLIEIEKHAGKVRKHH